MEKGCRGKAEYVTCRSFHSTLTETEPLTPSAYGLRRVRLRRARHTRARLIIIEGVAKGVVCMNEKQIKNVLGASAFWMVNKALAHRVGFDSAALIAELIGKHEYWKARGLLKPGGWFFMTSDDIQAVMGVSERQAKRLTASVKASGVVEIVKKGVPAKNHWRIDFDLLSEILNSDPTSQAGTVPTGEHESAPTGQAETVPTITNNTDSIIQSNAADASFPYSSFPYYREICDIFAKGFEKLEGSKLSWKGKERAFGKAIKTIIAQAVDVIGTDQATNLVLQEIERRARALYWDIEQNRKAKLRKAKHDEFIAKQKFTPLLLMNRWNSYPVARIQPSVHGSTAIADPVATMTEAERAQHEALK